MARTLTPDRQAFRALVADVAARAKARLPEAVNGRVESAARLVLMHDVMPQADGTILVDSSSDPMKTYLLQGETCECQDWQHGKAPQGWCQHRIAAGILKRVNEVLTAETPAPVELPREMDVYPDNDPEPEPQEEIRQVSLPLPEAPASVNVRLTIGGREVQWTLRDTDEIRLAARLEALLARYPQPQAQTPGNSQPQPAPQAASQLSFSEEQFNFHKWSSVAGFWGFSC